jgi:hypothetical protein
MSSPKLPYLIPISELINAVPPESLKQAEIPEWLQHLLHLFGVAELNSYWDDEHVIYEGRVQPIVPLLALSRSLEFGGWKKVSKGKGAAEEKKQGWGVKLFGVKDGWPFTLWVKRETGTSGTALVEKHEPASKKFLLHVHIPSVEILADPDAVQPARLHTEPHTYVEADPAGPRPTITLPRATVIYDSEGTFTVAASESWEDAALGTGDVILRTQMSPRYVILGGWVGLGLDQLVIDLSTQRSPAEVVKMPGYGPSWQGVYLPELLVYLPVKFPQATFAVRAKDFVVGGDGLVTGQFMAEFAKDYPMPDGKVKIGPIAVKDVKGKIAFRSLDATKLWEEEELNNLLERGESRPPIDLYANADEVSVKLSAQVSGAKKPFHYEWRVGDRTVGAGKKAASQTPVTVEATDVELDRGYHTVGLFVHEKLPVSSGARRAIAVAVSKADEHAPPTPVESLVGPISAQGWTGYSRPAGRTESTLYLCGVAPYTVEARLPAPPVGWDVEYAWRLQEVGSTTAFAESKGPSVMCSLEREGRYEIVLDLTVKKRADQPGSQDQKVTRKLPVEVYRATQEGSFSACYLELQAGYWDSATLPPQREGGPPSGTSKWVDRRVAALPDFPSYGPIQVSAKAWVWKLDAAELKRLVTQKDTVLAYDQGSAVVKKDLRRLAETSRYEFFLPSEHENELIMLEVTWTRRTEAQEDQAIQIAMAYLFDQDAATLTSRGQNWVRFLAEQIATQAWVDAVEITVPRRVDGEWAKGVANRRGETIRALLEAEIKKSRASVPNLVIKAGQAVGQQVQAILKPKRGGSDRAVSATRRVYVTNPPARRPSVTKEKIVPVPAHALGEPPLFRADWFRRLRLEAALHRSEFTKGQIETVFDLYDLDLPKKLQVEQGTTEAKNDAQGLVRMLWSVARDPATGRLRIATSYLADPRDKDGLFHKPFKAEEEKTRDGTQTINTWSWLNPYLFVLPPIAALTAGDVVVQVTLTAAAAGLTALLRGLEWLKVPQIIVQGFRGSLECLGDEPAKLTLGVDYDVDVVVRIPPKMNGRYFIQAGASKPIRVRYRDVGVFVGGKENFGFHYKPEKGFGIDIKDEGILTLPDWLGSLLTISRLRMGIGSPLSVQVDIGLKQNLGFFKVSTLPLRLEFDPDGEPQFKPSIGPMRVGVDIPNVLTGSGLLNIKSDPNFSVRGSLQVGLLQPKFSVQADLGIEVRKSQGASEDLTAVYAALFAEFCPGVPLGPTGAALYGVGGLFAMHFARDDKDVAGDVFRWYAEKLPAPNARAIDKWHVPEDAADCFAFGVGAVLGTASDGGRAFNAKGMFILELPGPRLLLVMRANLLSKRPKLNQKETGTIVAAIDLDLDKDHGHFLAKLAVRYEIEKVLKVTIPAEVYFDFKDPRNFHIWLGQHLPLARRIEIDVLGFLKAWGYLMIQGLPIENLAGKGVTIPGPAIAMGFRADFFWGSRPAGIYLEGYLEIHAGLGISPFFIFGIAEVGGGFHLFIVGLEVSAKLQAQADQTNGFSLEGEICGKVKLLFWEVKGCLSFKLGPEIELNEPAGVVERMRFRHRATDLPLSVEKGKQRQEIAGAVSKWDGPRRPLLPVEWPDPVPIDARPVLGFRAGMNVADALQGCFDLSANPKTGWSGWDEISSDLKYRYEVTGLRLYRVEQPNNQLVEVRRSGDERFTAVWSAGRASDPPINLSLLDWQPHRHLMAHGLSGTRDEVEGVFEQYFRQLCAQPARAALHLYTFDDQRTGPDDSWRLLSKKDRRAPVVVVRPPECSDARRALVELGWEIYERAQVVDFVPPNLPPKLARLKRSLKLPVNDGAVGLEAEGLVNVRVFVATRAGAQIGPLFARDAQGNQHRLQEQATIAPLGQGQAYVVREFALTSDATILRVEIPSATHVLSPPVVDGDVIAGVPVPPSIPQDYIYLLAVEGQVHDEVEEYGENGLAEQRQKKAQETWNHWISDGVAEDELLRPDKKYLLEVTVKWECQAQIGAGKDRRTERADGTQKYDVVFRTAAKPPEDLSAYVEQSIPAARGESHYYTDPLAVAFKTSSIQHHVRQYEDRRFIIYAKSERGVASVAEMVSQAYRPLTPDGEVEAALRAAMKKAKCLALPSGGIRSLGHKLVGTLKTRLAANAGYRGYLVSVPKKRLDEAKTPEQLEQLVQTCLAQKPADSTGEPMVHFEWPFTTSRWPTFSAHVGAFEGISDMVLPDGLDARFPADKQGALLGALAEQPAVKRSDRLLEEVLYKYLQAEALPPAVEPMGYRLWRKLGSDTWQCLGLLLDSPEPLFREGSPINPQASKLLVGHTAMALVKDGQDQKYALLTNAQGTRALIWSPGLQADALKLAFTFTKPSMPPPAKKPGDEITTEEAVLLTTVLAKPGAYLEEN